MNKERLVASMLKLANCLDDIGMIKEANEVGIKLNLLVIL